jgi:hypothetical protein
MTERETREVLVVHQVGDDQLAVLWRNGSGQVVDRTLVTVPAGEMPGLIEDLRQDVKGLLLDVQALTGRQAAAAAGELVPGITGCRTCIQCVENGRCHRCDPQTSLDRFNWATAGVDTTGCSCGNDGKGSLRHDQSCRWVTTVVW